MNDCRWRNLVTMVGLVCLLAACGGTDEGPSTISSPVLTETVSTTEQPATADFSTPAPDSLPGSTVTAPIPVTPGIQSVPNLTDDAFLPIDEILSEIDNDVCQNAYETKAELEALIAEGADLVELEMALDELIEELENCPTPTPE